MDRKLPQITFELAHLKTAEEALQQLHRSHEYQEYRTNLFSVQSLEQRYALSYRFKDLLKTEYELKYAIQESRTTLDALACTTK